MKNLKKIDIFRPECFTWEPVDYVDLYSLYGKKWRYASKGRYALYHILKYSNIKGKILIPVYVCETVLIPLKLLNIEPIFYDINLDDLNANISSIERIGKQHDISAVLVVSMYGNPADYESLEIICKKNNWFMIDDGAQAMGAKVNGRYVGTFGDAGFYSFSPGKPTAGPMGAFYWLNNMCSDTYCIHHKWLHKLFYYEFYINRVKIYDNVSILLRKLLSLLALFANKVFDIKEDGIEDFEQPILSHICARSLGKYMIVKNKIRNNIIQSIEIPGMRFLKAKRGKENAYKLVIIAKEKSLAKNLIKFLNKNGVYARSGYSMLTCDFALLPNAAQIDGCVVEIPLECSVRKKNFLIKVLKNFRCYINE